MNPLGGFGLVAELSLCSCVCVKNYAWPFINPSHNITLVSRPAAGPAIIEILIEISSRR